MDIATWLEALGLGEYVEAFSRNHVTPDILTSLTDPDLKDIGVASLGHRRTLLAAIAALASGAAALKRVPPKEQRHVAILFADLTDFTGLAQRLGAERLHDLATRYAAISEEAVARYGGTVDKHIGDAAMALFGTPVAHGDDALRAVRCALAIHAAMPALGGEFGLSLSAHIGIAVGDVVAGAVGGDGRSGYTVLGDAVNLAARLAGLAGPGETLVANDLRRAVEPAIAFSKIGPRAIKGYAAEIPVFRVEGFSSDGASGPFVGRQAELAQLDALLDLCGQGRGHVAVLRGEPGIGKSRLLAEAGARAASRGFKLIRGQALDFGEIDKRDPLAQIVGDMIRVAGQRPNSNPDGDRDGDPARSLAKNLAGNLAALVQSNAIDRATADLLADVAGGDRTQAVIDWLRAMDAATRDRKRQAAIAALAEAAARQGPLFVMVEDVHWAERSQVDQLAALAAAMTDWPILFAITTRLDVDPLDAAWRAQVGATPITVLDLRTLRTDDCLALARQALGDNESLARMCVDRAEGNPLFLDQILRYARDALSDTVPASIKSLVLSRLDQISSVDRNQVQAASVLGQRIDPAALAHVIGLPAAGLDEPIKRGILRRTGDGLAFAHALVRDAIYESLLPSERRKLHQRAAAWFADRDRAQQAAHLVRAEDPAAAAGAFVKAASDALERFEPSRALVLVDQALALGQASELRRAALAVRGDSLLALGSAEQAAATFRDLRELSTGELSTGEDGRIAALLGLASALRITDQLQAAFAAIDEAEPLAARAGNDAMLARIQSLRGNLHFPLGHIEQCLAAHQSALAAAERALAADAQAQALGGLGDAEYARGRMMTACQYFSRCVEKAKAAGAARIAVSNQPMLAITLILANDLARALAEAECAIADAQRIGHMRAELIARHGAYWALAEMARYAEALPHVERAQDIARALGAARFEPENLCFIAHVYARTGKLAEARQYAADALSRCRATGMAYIGPTVLGTCASLSPDSPEKAAWMAEAEAILASGSPGHNHFWFHRDAIDIGLADRNDALVARSASALEAFTSAEPIPWASFVIARGRALAAAQREPNDAAIRSRIENLVITAKAARLAWALPRLEAALRPQ